MAAASLLLLLVAACDVDAPPVDWDRGGVPPDLAVSIEAMLLGAAGSSEEVCTPLPLTVVDEESRPCPVGNDG